MPKLAIIGASGKLAFATLNALLEHQLIAPTDIICTTSSTAGAAKLEPAQQRGVTIRNANFDSPASLVAALQDCTAVFLVSSPRIEKDFHNAPAGHGRETDHFRAIDAAQQAGVRHVYYTSLAFANPSRSNVMKAHERTEAYLQQQRQQQQQQQQSGGQMAYTLIREGLYNESWPLYLGYHGVHNETRHEILVGGDGRISWTSIGDLGLANALILAAPAGEWAGRTVYLSQARTHTLDEVAGLVGTATGREVKLRVVSRAEHERHYVDGRGMDAAAVEWWSTTYDALREGECEIRDGTLEELLATRGVKPESLETTIKRMVGGSS